MFVLMVSSLRSNVIQKTFIEPTQSPYHKALVPSKQSSLWRSFEDAKGIFDVVQMIDSTE